MKETKMTETTNPHPDPLPKGEGTARPGLRIKLLDFDSVVRNAAGELVTVKKGEVIDADGREGQHLVDCKRAELVVS